jgi:CRP/FNR family transcriptional regulator, cyclic AMP receptor protein
MLKNIPLFTYLTEPDLEALTAEAVNKSFPKNTVIINEGEKSDSLYVILSGRVKVMMSGPDGREIILTMLGAGEFFGELSLFDSQPRSATVATMEPSQFSVISKGDFKRVMAKSPQMSDHVMQGLAQRLREADKKISSLALMDVYGRVARTLLQLAVKREGVLVVSDKLSQQDIANMVGASREMVNRILKELEGSGYIKVESKNIIINDQLPLSL